MTVEDKRLRLVIVDDEPRVSRALEREIRIKYPDSGFDVRSYDDPLACLSELRSQDCDAFLVISDLRMPAMNGADLLERVHAADPDIQTVLLTAYSDMDDIRRAISSNIRSLIPKPWDQAGLFAEIDGALAEYKLRKENARLKEELARQLDTAGRFQSAILGAFVPPAYPRIDVEYQPLERMGCGGDYYDAFTLPDGRTALILGDVSGHGIKPALVTLIIKTIVQNRRYVSDDSFATPSGLLATLNGDLSSILAVAPGTIIALAAAFVDSKAMTITVANAGLPDVVLCAAGKAKARFALDGPALGFDSDCGYSESTAAFSTGDRLVMHSDGLVDIESSGQALPPDEVAEIIAQTVGYGIDAAGVCSVLRSRHPDNAFSDDVTVMIATM